MVVFMPFANIMFFAGIGAMEGRSYADIKHRWRTVSYRSGVFPGGPAEVPLLEFAQGHEGTICNIRSRATHQHGRSAAIREAALSELRGTGMDIGESAPQSQFD